MTDTKSQFLQRKNKPDLAYIHHKGDSDKPRIMFLGGFRSDMRGSKACFLQQQCEARGQSYVRFDYSGHGESGGEFVQGCISDWHEDAQDVLQHCIKGDVILVGSSMGGWISLLLANDKATHIVGLVGIAAAPDFTGWMEEGMSDTQVKEMSTQGYIELPSDYGTPYIITKKLIEDGRSNFLMNKDCLNINVPVRLLQGKQDKDVPWKVAEAIKNHLSLSPDVQIIYREQGNHSLSAPKDLEALGQAVDALSVLNV